MKHAKRQYSKWNSHRIRLSIPDDLIFAVQGKGEAGKTQADTNTKRP